MNSEKNQICIHFALKMLTQLSTDNNNAVQWSLMVHLQRCRHTYDINGSSRMIDS